MRAARNRSGGGRGLFRKDMSGRSVVSIRRVIHADFPVRQLVVHLLLALLLAAVAGWAMTQGERNLGP